VKNIWKRMVNLHKIMVINETS
ncbi:MAG: hypothetical protein RJB09_2205, partial [Pseudomonadota bacterium]